MDEKRAELFFLSHGSTVLYPIRQMDSATLEICRHNFCCVRELIRICSHFDIGEIASFTGGRLSYSEEDESKLESGNPYAFILSFECTDEAGQLCEGEYSLEDFEHMRFEDFIDPKYPKTVVYMPEAHGPFGSFGEVELTFWTA